MKTELALWIKQLQPDGSAELFLRFKSEDFAGQSSAWIAVSQLGKFVQEISSFPMDSGSDAKLVGGFLDRSGKEIEEELVCMRVKASGKTGGINIFVKVTVPQDDEQQQSPKYSATASFRIDYEQLATLAKCLRQLETEPENVVSLTFLS
jgi:hypothetical protein